MMGPLDACCSGQFGDMLALVGAFNLEHRHGMQSDAEVASTVLRESAMAFLWALARSLP